MKKFFALGLALLIMIMSLAGCAQTAQADGTTVRIAGLKGPTSLGMLKLMADNAEGKTRNKYEFTLAGSADEITPKLIQGEIDMAAVPANLAAVLYNNTEGNIKLLAINTLGVLYIVERGDTIHSVSDLKGRTIYGSGKGSTPEYALEFILKQNGLDPGKDVNIEWKSEHTEVVQMLAADENAVGLLPQPFVTVAAGQVEGLRTALDLTEEWKKTGAESQMITGVLAVRKDFAEKHEEKIRDFLKEYADSVKHVNDNVREAAELSEKFDIIKAAVAEKAIPRCNIVCISGKDMQKPMEGYLKVLFDANPKSVGGKLPESDFYFQ